MAMALHVRARAALGTIGAGAVAAATVFAAAPSASADPLPPNCTAADLAQVTTGVSAANSVYLFTHPDVNAFFTDLEGLPPDTVRARIADYTAANPQVQAELAAIRQPLVDMRTRCGGSSDDEA
ncbi:heme-binding protein [Mycolicibacterium hodleri]|uniref:Hemophore-related protein n=1 Tax=Mycolicibacterium hodleri TaxID=49897 RepID=A0A502DZG4_9MYCO|nr:heme-binding protein [Mycolicibacterium hodleri]TPG29842.1 hemophore-related protein [Mycolicibacterium hodleri]